MKAPAGIALFDPTATMARSLATFFARQTIQVPRLTVHDAAARAGSQLLPKPARRRFFALSSLTYAVSPKRADSVRSDVVAGSDRVEAYLKSYVDKRSKSGPPAADDQT